MPKSYFTGLFAVLLSSASVLGCARSADEPYNDVVAPPEDAAVDAAPTNYPAFDASKPVDASPPPHDSAAPIDAGTTAADSAPPPVDAAPPPVDSGPPLTNMTPCVPTDPGQAFLYGVEAAQSNQSCPCSATQCCVIIGNKCVDPI